MHVHPIITKPYFKGNPEKKHKLNKYDLIPITGYGSIGLGITSGALAHNKKYAAHKLTAFTSIGMALGHVILLKTLYKNTNN